MTFRWTHRERVEIQLLSIHKMALDGGGWLESRSGLFTPVKTQYPLYEKLGWPQGWSGRMGKISPATRFSPQTVRPVASRYTEFTLCNFSHTFHLLYVITNETCTPKLGLRCFVSRLHWSSRCAFFLFLHIPSRMMLVQAQNFRINNLHVLSLHIHLEPNISVSTSQEPH